jgi:prepilin peptidase CpaA
MIVAALLFAWAAAISWSDWTHRRVPNVALLLVLVPAVLALVFQGQGLLGARVWSSLGGMALGFALTLPGYLMHRLGAGDVKFAAVLGLLLGTVRGFEMVLLASVLMGLGAAALLLMWKFPKQTRFPAAPLLSLAFVAEMLGGPWLDVWS